MSKQDLGLKVSFWLVSVFLSVYRSDCQFIRSPFYSFYLYNIGHSGQLLFLWPSWKMVPTILFWSVVSLPARRSVGLPVILPFHFIIPVYKSEQLLFWDKVKKWFLLTHMTFCQSVNPTVHVSICHSELISLWQAMDIMNNFQLNRNWESLCASFCIFEGPSVCLTVNISTYQSNIPPTFLDLMMGL